MATPPAVAAICWNIDGCAGAATDGETAVGGGCATADGGGAALAAGGGEGLAAGADDICLWLEMKHNNYISGKKRYCLPA